MPRTVVDLSTPRVAFNDEPLLSAEIWRSAQAIAQAPAQLHQIRMAEDERQMQARERGARILHMQHADERQAEQDRLAREDLTYNRSRQERLDAATAEHNAYLREHARQRTEMARDKIALDAETAQAKAGAKAPGSRLDEKRYASILKMADEVGVVPHQGEDERVFARRVEEAAASKHNLTPDVPVDKAAKMIPELRAMKMSPEEVAGEAQRISSTSTPRAKAGAALRSARAASPDDFNIPTLQQQLDPSTPASAPTPAPAVVTAQAGGGGPVVQASDPVQDEIARIPQGGLAAYMAELATRDPDMHDKVAAVVGWKKRALRPQVSPAAGMADIMARTPGFGGYGPGQPR